MKTGADGATFQLKDIVLEGGTGSDDIVQLLEPTRAAATGVYRYVSVAEANKAGDASAAGWYTSDFSERVDDYEFSLGTGFLACWGSLTVVPRFAGQVIDGSYMLDCVGKKYVLFSNPVPREITLGDVVLDGGSSSDDIVQVLESNQASAVAVYRYVSVEEATNAGDPNAKGWYLADFSERADNVKIDVSQALLANFGSKNVKITFPAAY